MSFDGTNKVKIKLPDEVKRTTPEAEAAPEADGVQALPPPTVSMKRARSINLQEYLEHGLAELKEQLNNYQEVCARFSTSNWELPEVTDYLFIMIKALNFDAISVMVLEQSSPGAFMPMVSRGYFHPPTLEVEKFWQQSIHDNGMAIEWNKLLALTQREKSPLVNWMENEKIHRIGYSPIQDGDRISGFITIASYAEKKLSPLASILLELCGGHIGLALTARMAKKQLQLQTNPAIVREHFLALKKLLQWSEGAPAPSAEDMIKTLAQGQAIIDDALTGINKN